MSTKPTSFFRSALIALSALVVGMVLASRLGLSPASFAGNLTVPATNSAPLNGPIDASTFRTIAQAANPSVVSIRTTATRQGMGLEDLFGLDVPRQQGQGRNRQAPTQVVQGAGSGFIIDKNGYILTNNHVVEDATRVEVFFAGMTMGQDRGLPAKVIGTDVLSDTALIQLTQLPDQPLTVAKFGDSSQLAQGDWVMAIGNPFALSNTVTVGVVSAVGRQQQTAVSQRFEEMIQTDAAINRGNSGGPLLNIRGEVVGINTQIVSDSQGGGNLGIGFAIPINAVRDILPSLEKGKVVRGRIGVRVLTTNMTKEDAEDRGLSSPQGAIISDVGEGPAKAAGMRPDDVVVEFNGKPVRNSAELVAMVTATAPGTTVPVKVYRARKPLTLNIKVEELNIEDEQASTQPTSQRQNPNAPVEEPKDTGFGMSVEGLTPQAVRRFGAPANGGAIVTEVEPAGAAAQGGIRQGDVIMQINGTEVTSVGAVTKALEAVQAGHTARLIVSRDGKESLVLLRKQ